ncbi:hypothetical protein Tco_1042578 [Tanacetum coccineum]|uniref:Uncharacterized protein n=1 Tax=Tanacetum coccineum TaxID=301880 RepID=A0ABQ5GJI9_9ASTR
MMGWLLYLRERKWSFPGIDDPKRHYGFKLGLLGKSVSLGVDISNWEMFDDDWGLESKEVSPLGEELSLFDRPNEVERGGILEAHRLESILQQQISQHMAPSHHDGLYRHYHPHLNSSVGDPPLYLLNKGRVRLVTQTKTSAFWKAT